MSHFALNRRGFVVAILALAGCQTATGGGPNASGALTSKFDGRYEIYIGRYGKDTARLRQDNEVGTEGELTTVVFQATNGSLSYVSMQDRTRTNPPYRNLAGGFYSDGTLKFSAVGNVLYDTKETRRIEFSVDAGERLLAGETVAFQVDDWDENWAASVRVRKL